MKLLKKVETEILIDVTFPFFTSNGFTYCKFYSENDAVTLNSGFDKKSFHIEKHFGFPESWMLFPQITEKEFNEKLNEVKKLIEKI